jgi:hypothetical protein
VGSRFERRFLDFFLVAADEDELADCGAAVELARCECRAFADAAKATENENSSPSAITRQCLEALVLARRIFVLSRIWGFAQGVKCAEALMR